MELRNHLAGKFAFNGSDFILFLRRQRFHNIQRFLVFSGLNVSSFGHSRPGKLIKVRMTSKKNIAVGTALNWTSILNELLVIIPELKIT